MRYDVSAGVPAGAAPVSGVLPPPEGGGVAGRLARQAVRYAATLDSGDRQALAVRLYCYGRLPLTPRWARRFSGPAVVAEHLGVGRGGAHRAAVERHWVHSGDPAAPDGWLAWARRDPPAAPAPGALGCKLYLSPRPEALGEAFGALVAVLADTDATAFKVGKDAHGLLRPDKLVAYFPSTAGLRRAAAALRARLRGVPAHGVPFTAPLTPDALLSWGIDPPALPGGAPESWRLWVAHRLADAIARDGARGASAAPRALEIFRREYGVSPDSWEPPAAWLAGEGVVWS